MVGVSMFAYFPPLNIVKVFGLGGGGGVWNLLILK